MKNKTMFKILFLSLVLSSCGLIERFKTPEQPTDSSSASSEEVATSSHSSADATDDLFSKTMEETSVTNTDSPGNISHNDSDLKSLEDEFSSTAPTESKEAPIALTPDRSQEAPVIVEESLPEINTQADIPAYSEAGEVKTYKVKKGETLMQIAFKLYGDIGKWKELKNMNAGIGNNTALRANTELKYRAPASPFVWNPAGSPYLIKNGETLGTISNTVYSTPKKWKAIWENNKPLIKNPNVIYAGFTLYYTNGGMANYVQPKSAQPKQEVAEVEEVVVDSMSTPATETPAPAVTRAPAAQAAPAQSTVNFTEEDNQQVDEAIQSLSAPKRETKKEEELDLINNVSVPHENNEIAPDIDEEIQTL